MVNLITTIIAIALAATVTMFGLDYGTRSFNQLRARNNATQIIADGRSIAQAWKNYSAAKNGNYLLGDYNWADGTATDLISTYLAKIPTPPANTALAALNYYFPIKLGAFATGGCSGVSNGVNTNSQVDAIALRITSPALCRAIAKAGDEGAPTLKAVSTPGDNDAGLSGDLTAISTRRPYDCVYVDSNASGGLNDGDAMLVFYALFNQ